MRRETKQLKNRTPQGRLNFCITKQGHFLGERKTAHTVTEMVNKAPKNWATIEYRDNRGLRICVTRDFMEEAGWTVTDTIKDWVDNMEESDFEEPIKAMGKEFGVFLEW